MKNVKVVVKALTLLEKDDKAEGVVEVNGKERKVVVQKIYKGDGKYENRVTIDGLDNVTLKELDITLETDDLEKEYKRLLKERDDAKEQAEKDRKEAEYKGGALEQARRKLIPLKFVYNYTLENFLKKETYSRDLNMTYTETHKGEEIKIVVNYEPIYSSGWRSSITGHRFVVRESRNYNREGTRRVQKMDSLVKVVNEMLEECRHKVEYRQKAKTTNEKALKQMQDRFGGDVRDGMVYGRYGVSSGSSCYELKWKNPKADYQTKGVKFSGAGNSYRLLELEGYLTEEQMKEIIAIAKASRFDSREG